MAASVYTPVEDVLDLRWRDEQLSVRQIHDKMARVLDLIDRMAEVHVQLAETSAKNVVKRRCLRGSFTWIWTRTRKSVQKTSRTPGTRQWLAEFVHVGLEINRILGSQQPAKCTHFQYAVGPTQASNARQMIMNWAVTLEVHPFCLGIILDTTGLVFVPAGFRIDYTQKINMLIRVPTRGTVPQGRHPIPSQIVDLKVVHGNDIEAVVVTEHRSMNTELDSFLTNNKNVIVIMTAGYPCVATREFLRLLADSRALKNALFLWISDHDPHAFQCYTTLKYGSAAMAWISPSTCVNRLELFGPTESHVQQLMDQEEQAKRREIKNIHPHFAEARINARATELTKAIRKRFADTCKKPLTKNDMAILKNVRKACHQDHWLNLEVDRMLETKRGKFGMHELDNVSKGCGLAFILQAVRSFVPVESTAKSRTMIRTAELASPIELDVDLALSSPARRNAVIESQNVDLGLEPYKSGAQIMAEAIASLNLPA
ncbi:MAG: hypothetical protein Q9193_002225 [Seirophora villosa]